jgi:acyl-CoA thioesterase-2
MPDGGDARILDAFDGLLRALELEPIGVDRFRVGNEPARFPRVFGGQLAAQALLAMSRTVDGQLPHSLHAHFVEGGDPDRPLEATVDRVRDGRSMSTRRVVMTQGERVTLIASASFQAGKAGAAPPAVPLGAPPSGLPPEALPRLGDWVAEAAPSLGAFAQLWIDRPPPLEVRIGEAPTFLGGARATGPRSHWLRLPRAVGDDRLLHAVLLTYASDYFLLDMAVRNHPEGLGWEQLLGSSLDHSVWLHRPVHFDRWHRYTQEVLAVDGERGLVKGSLHDADGALVATVVQEVLVRPRPGGA